MNACILSGTFKTTKRYYLSKDGWNYFNFTFVARNGHFEVYCSGHPPLNGQDNDVNKTHIFRSGKLCFVSGHEPRTQARAEELAGQWAEYVKCIEPLLGPAIARVSSG